MARAPSSPIPEGGLPLSRVKFIPEGGLPLSRVWEKFIRLPGPGGRLVRPTPHREQRAVFEASDAGQYPEIFCCWAKKTGKDETLAASMIGHQVASLHVRGVERLGAFCANDFEQADETFKVYSRLVQRDPWLAAHIRLLRGESVYEEKIRDERTGATFTLDHRVVTLARDTVGVTGKRFTHICRNEIWAEATQEFSEALVLDPSRPNGQTWFASYYPPKALLHKGAVFYDLMQRVQAHDPGLFFSYVGGEGADAAWAVAPWLSRGWIEQHRKNFSTCISRFVRSFLNMPPAGGESALITAAELEAALDYNATEPETGAPGQTYLCGVDLGISCDWSAVVVTHQDGDGKIVVDLVRWWRGTRARPVDLGAVESAILSIGDRFKLSSIVLDAWQAALMASRLAARGLPIRTVQLTASKVDQLISVLKRSFARRQIKIPARCVELVSQIESVVAVESGRRGLVKFSPSGTGEGAEVHDDIVLAAALSLDSVADVIGQFKLPAQRYCLRHASGLDARCFLWDDKAGTVPSDPHCYQACESWKAVRAAWLAAGGQGSVRDFYANVYGYENSNEMVDTLRLRAVLARAQIDI